MGNGLALWVLGGVGFLFLYAAVKNETPQSVLLNTLGQSTKRTPIASTTLPAGGSTGNGVAGGKTVDANGNETDASGGGGGGGGW